MSRISRGLASAAFFSLVAFPIVSSAGDKKKEGLPEVKRGAEHKVLESLVGAFEAKLKIFADPTKPPQPSSGLMIRKMILDGNFLQESFQGAVFGKAFKGMGIIGFDQAKKKYVSTWVDNMSTATMVLTGTYDAATKTLTNEGEDIQGGKKMKARDVLTILSADEQSFQMFRQPEGTDREFKVMEISYKRVKVEKK